MAIKNKKSINAVKSSVEEMEKKIKKHRKRIAIFIVSVALIVTVGVIAVGMYYQNKEYREYEVRSTIERIDSEATKYETFSGYILRYNNDGAFYTDLSDNLIWNQAFEMLNPMVDICGNYAVIADMQGTQIYIMDTIGMQGQVTARKPIEAVCVAAQGTIAVLTQEDGAGYLELYNRSGESLAFGEIHVANSGYPLAIALSDDANKLAVSILDISKGTSQTTIAFYNFGLAGQNEIDNMVGSYSYADTIIPEIDFVSNDRMIAFGDSQVILFEGVQKPEEVLVQQLEHEIKSIFFDTAYYGLVYGSEDSGESRNMEIYDMQGRLCLEKELKKPYQNIEFLGNHEICVQEEYECTIYTLRGVEKFTYQFDDKLYRIFSGSTGISYTFILDGRIEKIRLK